MHTHKNYLYNIKSMLCSTKKLKQIYYFAPLYSRQLKMQLNRILLYIYIINKAENIALHSEQYPWADKYNALIPSIIETFE